MRLISTSNLSAIQARKGRKKPGLGVFFTLNKNGHIVAFLGVRALVNSLLIIFCRIHSNWPKKGQVKLEAVTPLAFFVCWALTIRCSE